MIDAALIGNRDRLIQPAGMPALALPFVLVVWIFVLARRQFPRLLREMPSDVDIAELKSVISNPPSQISAPVVANIERWRPAFPFRRRETFRQVNITGPMS